MSTDLAVKPQSTEADVLEKVVVGGDLSRLTPDQRLQYYRMRCEAAGLDPRTQPFALLQLQGKLTLYATKAATDQLIAIHRLTVQILSREFDRDLGCYVVQCRVTFPDGHFVEDVGVLHIPEKLNGEPLANAMMKAITKSKRRTVLSACGLGMLDETEVETIPGAATMAATDAGAMAAPANDSGHGRGQYASPDQVKRYVAEVQEYLDGRNAKWIDRWTDDVTGEVPAGVKDLCNIWQLDNHCVKWAVETGRLDAASLPEGGIKHRQIGMYTAIVDNRSRADKAALRREMVRYVDQQEERQSEALRKKHPELFGDGNPDATDADEAQGLADEDPAE